MSMTRYFAILSKDNDSAFGVHFPDLPGCTSGGDTMDDALGNAAIALRMWAEDVVKLPDASSMEALLRKPDVIEDLRRGSVVLMVPLLTAGRKQRLNIMLEPDIIEAADRAAEIAGVSRSVYIEYALESLLSRSVGAVRRPAQKVATKVRRRAGHKA
jgi:predicted RNase H-like HicB family nuclease